MNDSQLLSADEVADLLDVAPSTLAKWRQSGSPDLPYVQVGNRVFYRAKEVRAFLDGDDMDGLDDDEYTDGNEDEDEDEDDLDSA